MATTFTETNKTVAKERAWDKAEWYDSRYYKAGMALMLAVAVFWIWYQRTFAYSVMAWILWSQNLKKSGWVYGVYT